MKISRILHAGYIFECDDTRLIIDPIFENPFSGNCHAFPSVSFDLERLRREKFSAVFISHYHDDHCSLVSLDLFDRRTPIYLHCVHDELFELIRELGFVSVQRLEFNVPVRIGDFEVVPRQPMDSDVDSMLQIKLGDLNVLNVVDSVFNEGTAEYLSLKGPWDLVLWPFQMMRETGVLSPSRASDCDSATAIPADWIDDLRMLNPRFVVPSSCQFIHEEWSWYNNALFPITYSNFEKMISSDRDKSSSGLRGHFSSAVVRMNPGTSFELSKESLRPLQPLPWITPVGPQDVDYAFNPSTVAPPTSVIASKFSALSAEENLRVVMFCESELLAGYQKLEATEYFSKPRVWQLSLFDHHGEEQKWFYDVTGNSISRAADPRTHARVSPVGWKTELPVAKLYAALERGEALTSMYVRVNDCEFSGEIETELTEMNVLEDPLIRVLFSGKVANYQKNQLSLLTTRF